MSFAFQASKTQICRMPNSESADLEAAMSASEAIVLAAIFLGQDRARL
jgi:hypothetical protein